MKQLLAEYIKTLMEIDDSLSIDEAPIPKEDLGKKITYTDRRGTERSSTIKTIQKKGSAHPAWSQYQDYLSGLEADGRDSTPEKKPEEEPKEKVDTDVAEIVTSLYGEGKGGPLLQGENSDAQKSLDLGYVRGADHVAPGNASSNFNENISNEGVFILDKYPELSETELAEILYQRTSGSTLASQVNRISPVRKISYPDGLNKEEKDVYSACVVAARSAIAKSRRSSIELEGVSEDTFGSNRTNVSFGGTANDLKLLSEKLESGNNIYVYDEVFGLVSVPKEDILEWVSISGGGENAADTAVLTIDENNNILYQGWSDKTSMTDVQANSTLYSEINTIRTTLPELRRNNRLSRESARDAYGAVVEYLRNVKDIEDGYADISKINAEYFLNADETRLSELANLADESSSTTKHFNNFKYAVNKALDPTVKGGKAGIEDVYPKESGESDDEYYERLRSKAESEGNAFYLRTLSELAKSGKTTKNDNKVIIRLADAERSRFKKAKEELPETLDTRKALSAMRKKSIDSQQEMYKKLDGIPAVSRTGKEKTLGEILGARDSIEYFHLDKIDSPKDSSDTRQLLKRNTQLVMEGQPITPENIKDCLQVSSTAELEDQFKLVFDERYTYKDPPKNTIISGKVVVIYALDSEGGTVEVGFKEFRSKSGDTGKTETTIKWSKDMRDCFSSKG